MGPNEIDAAQAVEEPSPQEDAGPKLDPNHREKEDFFGAVSQCRRIILTDLVPSLDNRFGYGHEQIDKTHVRDAKRLLKALQNAQAVVDGWLPRHLERTGG